MITFGNKNRLAFSYVLDQDSGGEWMFGKCCYHIGGSIVGDYELGTSLRDVYLQMRYMVKDNGQRDSAYLCRLEDSTIFETLVSVLYGQSGKCTEHSPNIDMPARFDVRVPVDVFDFWHVFLVDCDSTSRLIYKNDHVGRVRSKQIVIGEFDEVIASSYFGLEEIYLREHSSS